MKLADTGIAKCIRESGRFDTSKSSLPYMSPELVDENYHYYTSSDIWFGRFFFRIRVKFMFIIITHTK